MGLENVSKKQVLDDMTKYLKSLNAFGDIQVDVDHIPGFEDFNNSQVDIGLYFDWDVFEDYDRFIKDRSMHFVLDNIPLESVLDKSFDNDGMNGLVYDNKRNLVVVSGIDKSGKQAMFVETIDTLMNFEKNPDKYSPRKIAEASFIYDMCFNPDIQGDTFESRRDTLVNKYDSLACSYFDDIASGVLSTVEQADGINVFAVDKPDIQTETQDFKGALKGLGAAADRARSFVAEHGFNKCVRDLYKSLYVNKSTPADGWGAVYTVEFGKFDISNFEALCKKGVISDIVAQKKNIENGRSKFYDLPDAIDVSNSHVREFYSNGYIRDTVNDFSVHKTMYDNRTLSSINDSPEFYDGIREKIATDYMLHVSDPNDPFYGETNFKTVGSKTMDSFGNAYGVLNKNFDSVYDPELPGEVEGSLDRRREDVDDLFVAVDENSLKGAVRSVKFKDLDEEYSKVEFDDLPFA